VKRLADVECSIFEIDGGVSKFDLSLSLETTQDGCSGWIEYATGLFNHSTIGRIAEEFKALLWAATDRPEMDISRLSQGARQLLSPAALISKQTPVQNAEPSDNQVVGMPIHTADATGVSRQAPLEVCQTMRFGLIDEALTNERRRITDGVARIWSEVLGIERPGIHETIFDLGGHSLLITKIISRIHRTFDVEVPIQAFFETPTLGEIVGQVEWLMQRADSAVPCA
jgi:acyl carrier protein